jgi:hypothetical protein
MTRLTNELIKESQANSVGWQLATQALEAPVPQTIAVEGK